MKPNIFLASIAILTSYLIFMGWVNIGRRRATYVKLLPIVSAVFLLLAIASLGAILMAMSGQFVFQRTFLITGAVFSLIAILFSLRDLYQLRAGEFSPTKRVISHLVNMCAALIATTTAVCVTLFGLFPELPQIIAWLGPTIIITPVIFYNARQVAAGKKIQV